MAKNSKVRDTVKRNGAGVQRLTSRQLFDDILALADMPSLKAQAVEAGDHLEGFAAYALHTNIEQMVRDVGTFTRRHPVAALAIVAATALVASRFKRRAARKLVRSRPVRKPARAIARKAVGPRRKGSNGQAHANA